METKVGKLKELEEASLALHGVGPLASRANLLAQMQRNKLAQDNEPSGGS